MHLCISQKKSKIIVDEKQIAIGADINELNLNSQLKDQLKHKKDIKRTEKKLEIASEEKHIKEVEEQLKGPEAQARELEELAQIYVSRGVPYHLAFQVAHHLTEQDVIRAHARDELGIDMDDMANPWQAAGVSFLCFGVGATIPLLAGAFLAEEWARILSILLATTGGLVIFGMLPGLQCVDAVPYSLLRAHWYSWSLVLLLDCQVCWADTSEVLAW